MEWQVFLVLAEVVGLAVLVGKPVLALNKTITEFNTELRHMTRRVDRLEENKREAHERLWEHNSRQDAELADHESRIWVLEQNK